MNLAHYLLKKNTQENEALNLIIADIAAVGKKISHEVQRSGLLDLHGAAGGQNIHAEDVQKLDTRSNTIFKEILADNEHIIGLASEEEEDVVDVSNGRRNGFIVAFDPLDGSSNIDINMPVGTIFSVLPSTGQVAQDFLQSADKQVAAGYVLYGSSTVMVFSIGEGVHEFTLDPDNGEFVLTTEDIKIPDNTGYIAYNPYVLPDMNPTKAEAYRQLASQTARSMRWIGAMVADVHRTLMKGGFFAYPAVSKDGNYKGKLRLQYEAKPLGWLVEQAGGKALIDDRPVNQIQANELHQKVSVELGDPGTMRLFQDLIINRSNKQ